MRAVTRFRSLRLRSFMMPLLLAALALRVLIPDVMSDPDMSGMSVKSSMCSADPGRSELIEIPGDAPKPHCERCLLTPPFEAPYALLTPIFGPARPWCPCCPSSLRRPWNLPSPARNPRELPARLTSGSIRNLSSAPCDPHFGVCRMRTSTRAGRFHASFRFRTGHRGTLGGGCSH